MDYNNKPYLINHIKILSEIFPKLSERKICPEVSPDVIVVDPRKGDTIVVNPGTKEEIKIEITHVRRETRHIVYDERKYLRSIMDCGIHPMALDIVYFSYTFKGQTVSYDRNREYFPKMIKELTSKRGIVRCSRKFLQHQLS